MTAARQPAARRPRRAQAEAEAPTTGRVEVEDIDAILEDIDEILETNDLEVVRTYRQRGGE